ncbi:MAG TPA: PepSY-associated TM helix domain-containing protein [Candidatus Sulfotelmatobacter sp.]
MRKIILQVHLLVALIAGAFIAVLGATGSVIAFEPELDRLTHAHLSYVSPSGRVLTLQEIGDAVSRKSGGEPIVAYLLSESPDISWEVVLPRGIASVNQYTGEVLGVRTRGQSALGFARELHVRLASGDAGRNIAKWSGVATLISVTSGLYLWWPAKRMRIRGFRRNRSFWFELHNSAGIFLLVPLFVLAATGAVIGFEDQASRLLGKLNRPHTIRSGETATSPRTMPCAAEITTDQAVAIARAQMPGAVLYRVQMPRYGGAYRVSLDDPQDRVAGARNLMVIDRCSGDVISSSRSSDLLLAERILAANEAIHTGEVLGMPSRILACLTSVAVPVQVISGLLLWLRRRKIMPTAERGGVV